MGAYLSVPVRTKVSEDKCIGDVEFGVSSMQGWRMEQEDTHNCLLDFDKDTSLYAVYDGHGGADVAQYTAENLPDFLSASTLYKEGKLEAALKQAFVGFDGTLLLEEVQEKLKKLAEVNSDDEEDQEQEVGNLFEEAHMPLDQLLQRYKTKKEKFQSPMIRAKKDDQAKEEPDQDSKNIPVKLDDQLVNGHDAPGSAGDRKTDSKSDTFPDSSVSTNGIQKDDAVTKGDVPGPVSEGVVQSSDGKGDGPSITPDSVQLGASAAAVKSDTVTCTSSDSGVSVSTSSDRTDPDGSGSSSAVTSSDGGGSSECSGSAGASSTENQLEASSSSGRTRRKKSGVIPAEGEDEESFDEDEEDTEDEEDSDEDEKNWESDSEDDSDEDDDDGPFGAYGEDEEVEDEEGNPMAKFGGEEPGFDSGCTAVMALMRGRQLFVANAGDSRCVLCRDGKAVDMSEDHKPEDKPERDRITKAGGKITPNGRVNGGLNLSRAIGDHTYKQNSKLPAEEQMITALPDVKSITLEDQDEFIVLACDGIWNTMSSQDVVTFVRERIRCGVRPLSSICEEMFDLILAPDTTGDGTGCDNMTCIIVNLKAGATEITVKIPAQPKSAEVTDSSELKSGEVSDSSEVKSAAVTGSSQVKVSSEADGSSEAESSVDVQKMEESSEAEAVASSNSSEETSNGKRKADTDLEADSSSKKTKVDNADSSG